MAKLTCPKCGSQQICIYIAHPGRCGCYACNHAWDDAVAYEAVIDGDPAEEGEATR